MILRTGEVLQQVAVALGRHDPEVEPEAVLGDDGRLGVAVGDDLGDPGQADEMSRQRRRVGGGRDHVEVAEGLASPPERCRPRRLRPRSDARESAVDHLTHDRQPAPEEATLLGLLPGAGGKRGEDLLLSLRAEPLERADLLRARPPPSARPAWSPRARARSLPRSLARPLGSRRNETSSGGTSARRFSSARHRAGRRQLHDLLLDRPPDPGELLGLAGKRQLGHGRAGIADPRAARRYAITRKPCSPRISERSANRSKRRPARRFGGGSPYVESTVGGE